MAGFAAPVAAAGYRIKAVAAAVGLPAGAHEADLVVSMGGPMGAYQQAAHPWLTDEMSLLRARVAADRPTLGVCLGAQLLAAALGASVQPGPVKEVSFAPVRLLPAAAATALRHLADVPVLHRHGDTFNLPVGSERLAETDG